MAKTKWYWFLFEDGYKCCCMGMSKLELSHEVQKHGKLVCKILEGEYE